MKVTVVGAGNVGATCADVLACRNFIDEIVLLDVKEGVAEGKALDIWQTAPIRGFNTRLTGSTNDYSKTAGSDVVVITSGVPRKPGMSRDDLIGINAGIVKSVTEQVVKHSPDAKIIIVSNPLDVMTYCAYLAAKLPSNRVMGMAGVLDTARYRAFLADEIGCSPLDIQALLLGGHGDTMVPLPKYTTVQGIPVTHFVKEERLHEIIERAKVGGGELVKLLGTSAWYAPGAAAASMVEAILLDQKKIVPVCAWLTGEYGLKDLYLGVPVVLGRNGIEKVVEAQPGRKGESRSLYLGRSRTQGAQSTGRHEIVLIEIFSLRKKAPSLSGRRFFCPHRPNKSGPKILSEGNHTAIYPGKKTCDHERKCAEKPRVPPPQKRNANENYC